MASCFTLNQLNDVAVLEIDRGNQHEMNSPHPRTRLRRFAATARQALAPTVAAVRYGEQALAPSSTLAPYAPSHPRTLAPTLAPFYILTGIPRSCR